MGALVIGSLILTFVWLGSFRLFGSESGANPAAASGRKVGAAVAALKSTVMSD